MHKQVSQTCHSCVRVRIGADAWGGNQFLIGGGIKGGKLLGLYPELRVNGPNSISSTGQMLPSTPWEAIWKALATWLGVEETKLGNVMPNLHAFPPSQLLNESELFHS